MATSQRQFTKTKWRASRATNAFRKGTALAVPQRSRQTERSAFFLLSLWAEERNQGTGDPRGPQRLLFADELLVFATERAKTFNTSPKQTSRMD